MGKKTTLNAKRRADRIRTWIPIGILVINLGVMCLIAWQAYQQRQQNDILERTMRQTYRPVGVASYSPDLKSRKIKIAIIDAPPGTFSFIDTLYLHNRGKGVLSYLATFSCLWKERIDFRQILLEGQPDSVIQPDVIKRDGVPDYARRSPVHPDDYRRVRFMWYNLDPLKIYFLYTLFLYEDQDGGLYDTERLDVLKIEYKKHVVSKPDTILRPDFKEGWSRETYHDYTSEEERALIKTVKRIDPKLAEVIATGH